VQLKAGHGGGLEVVNMQKGGQYDVKNEPECQVLTHDSEATNDTVLAKGGIGQHDVDQNEAGGQR
jgi:hypothetical protein